MIHKSIQFRAFEGTENDLFFPDKMSNEYSRSCIFAFGLKFQRNVFLVGRIGIKPVLA